MANTTETQTQRIVLGNLTAKDIKGRKIIEGAICLDVLDSPGAQEMAYSYNGKRYLNVKIVQRKQPSDYGKTHFIEVDQFVPVKK